MTTWKRFEPSRKAVVAGTVALGIASLGSPNTHIRAMDVSNGAVTNGLQSDSLVTLDNDFQLVVFGPVESIESKTEIIVLGQRVFLTDATRSPANLQDWGHRLRCWHVIRIRRFRVDSQPYAWCV